MVGSLNVSFFVAGTPVAQGSTRGFIKGSRVVITSTAKGLKKWRKAIEEAAEKKWGVRNPTDKPVSVELVFFVPRGKTVSRTRPAVRPDLDKYVRAVLDSLTDILFDDDGQVIHIIARKDYERVNQPPGVKISAYW